MTERTGLSGIELQVLAAVEAVAGARPIRTTRALDHLAEEFGPAYALPVLQDLVADWRVHLTLVEGIGNWGSSSGDPPADPRYTEVALSAVGRCVFAAERGELGPVPLGLVNGTLYRGGTVPPWDPRAVLACLNALVEDPSFSDERLRRLLGPPTLPTGGLFLGDLTALRAGRRARLRMTCRIEREQLTPCPTDDQRFPAGPSALVITGTPLGVTLDEITHSLAARLTARQRRYADYLPAGMRNQADDLDGPARHIRGLSDETSEVAGTRIVIALNATAQADLDRVEAWVQEVWPVTVEAPCLLPAPITTTLRAWGRACREDPSGLRALTSLVE